MEIRYRNPRLRNVAKAYLAIPLLIAPAFPMLASDYVVSLPLMMVYGFGVGPVLAVVREKPTCRECGSFVSHRRSPA